MGPVRIQPARRMILRIVSHHRLSYNPGANPVRILAQIILKEVHVKKIALAFSLVLTLAGLAGCNEQTSGSRQATSSGNDYDLVLLNGRVMDPETKFDGVRNVGIKNGIIETITKDKISGKEVIDASGLVVAPGFIDTHVHSITKLGNKMLLLDGVTTPLSTEFGVLDIDTFYDQRKKWRSNYGATVGLNFARMKVLDNYTAQDDTEWLKATKEVAKKGASNWADKIPGKDEEKAIFAILKKGLDRGALGVGIAVGYAPRGTTAREVYEAQKLAGSYGRMTAAHTRFGSGLPPDEFVLGGDEIMANAMYLKAPAIFQHFHNADWQLAAELIKKAQERGYNIWGEIYPYAAYSTLAGADYLNKANLERNHQDISKTFFDPSKGRNLTADEFFKLRKEDPGHQIIVYSRKKEDIPKWLAIEGATVASDAIVLLDKDGNILPEDAPYDKIVGHPRSSGAHARALRMAREHNIPLMTVLGNLSYWSAKHIGDTGLEAMKARGRLQEGMVADITVFDPQTVKDNADYPAGKNGLPSSGIPYVIVNGVVAVRDSQLVPDAWAGQPIRFPVQ